MKKRGREIINEYVEEKSEAPLSEHIPLHRSYGKKRKVIPWLEKLIVVLLRVLTIWVMGMLLIVGGVGFVAFMIWYPEMWVKILVCLVIAFFVMKRLTRTIRKRRKFQRNLKKLCRKQGFSLSFEQNFFDSLVWSPDRQDFVICSQNCEWYVRYLTLGKYRSTLFFEKEDLIRWVRYPLDNKFTVIFDFLPTVKEYPIHFNIPASESGREQKKILVINPICREMKCKCRDGGYESTGNGGKIFDYTVYSGSGLLKMLERQEK